MQGGGCSSAPHMWAENPNTTPDTAAGGTQPAQSTGSHGLTLYTHWPSHSEERKERRGQTGTYPSTSRPLGGTGQMRTLTDQTLAPV